MKRLHSSTLCAMILAASAYLAIPQRAKADEPEAPVWTGSVELGAIFSAGNSETRNARGSLKAELDLARWTNQFLFETFLASNMEDTTAERFLADYKAKYRLRNDNYIFGSLRGERDQFAGFNYRFAETVGLGHYVWNSSKRTLVVELGPGLRQSKRTNGTTEFDRVGRAFLSYKQNVFDDSEFTEEFIVLAGDNNADFNSVTALSTRVYERFGLKLSLTVTHNTQPPSDTKKTDATTAVTLSYNFGQL
jgi:putative salt-induced outer membrane protein